MVVRKKPNARMLPALVMGVWAGMFAYLLFGERYQLFLKPEFSFLIIGGLTISCLFFPGLFRSGIPKDKDTTIKALFLLLPVLFIFSAGESTLGGYALSKRTLVSPETGSTAAPLEKMIQSNPVPDLSGENPTLVSISKLIYEWKSFEGKKVAVEGLFSGQVQGAGELSAVFRYFVTCCAADAQPVGLFLLKPSDKEIQDNAWVRVSGRVSIRKVGAHEMVFMDLESIEPREKPSKHAAYLYN